MINDFEFNQLMRVIRKLYNGEQLRLTDNHVIAMDENLNIGFVVNIKGNEGISALSHMNLRELHTIIKKHDIMII